MTLVRDDDDNDPLLTWIGIVRAVDAMQRHVGTVLQKLDLSWPSVPVLDLLAGATDQRLPMSQVGADLHMTSGAVTKLLDRMARNGLIDRRGSPADRTVVIAILTPAGADMAERARRLIRRTIEDAMQDNVTPAELGDTKRLLRRLIDALPA